MMGAFNRPIGAAADVKELEYISVLMQSQLPHLRKNCTVSATDISVFLHSRYGLNVPHKDALDIVLSLGGEGGLSDVALLEVEEQEEGEEKNCKPAATPLRKASLFFKQKSSQNNGTTSRPENSAAAAELSHTSSKKMLSQADNSTSEKVEKHAPDERYLDIVQLAGIILIPTLVQATSCMHDDSAAAEDQEEEGNVAADTSSTNILFLPSNPEGDDSVNQQLFPKKEPWETNVSPKIFLDVLRFIVVWLSDWDQEIATLDINDCNLEFVLTESRMRLILALIHEDGRTEDVDLINAMIECCAKTNDRGEFVLNKASFARALTSDVDLWSTEWIDRKSTFYFDVFGSAVGHLDNIFEEKRLQNHQSIRQAITKNLSVKVSKRRDANLATVDYSDFGITDRMLKHGTHNNAAVEPTHQETTQQPQVTDLERPTEGREYVIASANNQTNKGNLSQINITGYIYTAENASLNPPPGTTMKEDVESNHLFQTKKWAFSQTNNTGCIDFIVDAQWSRLYLAFAWAFFVVGSLVYSALFSSRNSAIQCEGGGFGCTLAKTILAWMTIAISMCVSGIIVFIPISLANAPFRRSLKRSATSLVAVICFTIPPFLGMLFWYKGIPHSGSEYTQVEKTASKLVFKVEVFIVFASGTVLLCFIAILMLSTAMYLYTGERTQWVNFWVTTHDVIASYCSKQSGTYKTNKLVANAHTLHFLKSCKETSLRGTEKITMLNYEVYGESEEECGGFKWVWRGLWTRSLFRKEGFWLHSNLFIGQIAQLFIGAWLSLLMFNSAFKVTGEVDRWRNDLLREIYIHYPDWVYRFIPEGWMIKASFFPAASIATLVMIFLFLFPLPCTASTVMKLRSGVIPSRRDPQFAKYRIAADTVALNLGNSIFSIVGSGIFFFFIVAVVLFLTVWPYTQSYMIILYAWLIGVFITIFLKTFITSCFRAHNHRGLYRNNQTNANIVGLLLECWHIGVAPGFLVSRITQFLLASALWIGRIDVPFLSDDVCLFGYHFDNVPTHYRKDILSHEAHRHPFVERIGAMYMMRLKHGSNFGTRAGSCWRNIFVLFLMPWLRKYQVINHKRLEGDRGEAQENILGDAINEAAMMFERVPQQKPTVNLPTPSSVLKR